MEVDGNGLEIIDSAECLRLLATQTLGRIALSTGALPVVFPVNFAVIDDRIVIRTAHGTSLARSARDSVVAFEVDEIDVSSGDGWSVMVQGFAREVFGRPELALARSAPLARWLEPTESMHVEISIDVISGRRVSLPTSQAKQADVKAANRA